jgi:hypothetical protein
MEEPTCAAGCALGVCRAFDQGFYGAQGPLDAARQLVRPTGVVNITTFHLVNAGFESGNENPRIVVRYTTCCCCIPILADPLVAQDE